MYDIKILRNLTVLYVDDDINACKSLERILKYYFNNVFIANNGKEALKIYKEVEFHLLIVDYSMPIMNGYEFLSQIRDIDDNISAIIISSYDDKVKLKNAIKLNLLDYITKPYELSNLQEVFSRFINNLEKKCLLKYKITENCFYDFFAKTIIHNTIKYPLTPSEILIFEYLLKNKNKVVRYEELFYILNSENNKSLITMVYKINKKLPFKVIENIKDTGYKIKT